MAGIDLHDPADGLWFYRHVFSDTDGVKGDDGRYRYELEIPMSELSQAWTDQGGSCLLYTSLSGAFRHRDGRLLQ